MRVSELWRYPVKSLRGESLETAELYFELDGVTALDCYVLEPGPVRLGDEAELLDYWTLPRAS